MVVGAEDTIVGGAVKAEATKTAALAAAVAAIDVGTTAVVGRLVSD